MRLCSPALRARADLSMKIPMANLENMTINRARRLVTEVSCILADFRNELKITEEMSGKTTQVWSSVKKFVVRCELKGDLSDR